MMILHVINSLRTGGAEKFVTEIASEMKRKGHDVEILVFDRTDSILTQELLTQNIRIRYTLSHKYLSLLNAFTFFRLMLGRRYSVIHTHLTYAQLWGAIASLWNIHRKQLVTTEHSTRNNRRGRSCLRLIDKFIYSRFHWVFCISSATRQSLLSWIKPRNSAKYIIAPNCVDVGKFKHDVSIPRQRILGIAPQDIVVMMVGRMDPAKDQPTLIRAVERLPTFYKCVLVGDGETMDQVRGSVTDSTRTIFLGYRSDIPALLQACDIYVQSSHWEGMPTTILEAMAAEKPVLGSDVPGVRDLLPSDQLFPEGDDRALADLIQALPGQTISIVARQTQTVRNLSVAKITDDILEYYGK